ncbi:energy-coupling factor transporter transmembrane component T [uncultured Paludibaculum sp.]|uniref:energy-coupling factor transporter transmembrane component T family protein n=1 Tax=uncultured Paludibaculum sp. TaxID=1765020 RepID=UPI002AAB517F|nr:energy-coupling factor transporter transmembrane component T [uncultured Paludibaculum sp.]
MAQRIGPANFAFDEWSRRKTVLHGLDPRGKIVACLALLILTGVWPLAWTLSALAIVLIFVARLPLFALAARAAVVLPFTVVFAALTAWTGDTHRAVALLWKSYLSALWVCLLMASTPLERLLEGAARLGTPRLLIDVMHFTWRYIAVISAQAWRMRTAALARGGDRSFQVSASSLAVLFASSYARAERIHRAMLARGAAGGVR